MLRDLLPKQPRECNVLVAALQERIQKQLADFARNGPADMQVALGSPAGRQTRHRVKHSLPGGRVLGGSLERDPITWFDPRCCAFPTPC